MRGDSKELPAADEIQIDGEVMPADEALVVRGLLTFNEDRLGPADERPVKFVARDSTGVVVGGILGHTRWRWLYVAKLWVDERARGHGLGTRLIAAAEDLARSRGCTDGLRPSRPVESALAPDSRQGSIAQHGRWRFVACRRCRRARNHALLSAICDWRIPQSSRRSWWIRASLCRQ